MQPISMMLRIPRRPFETSLAFVLTTAQNSISIAVQQSHCLQMTGTFRNGVRRTGPISATS